VKSVGDPATRDQTFSSENFKLIWDEEIRRGRPMAPRVPEVLLHNEQLLDLRIERKATLAPLPLNSEERAAALLEFSQRRSELLHAKRETVMSALEGFSIEAADRINASDFGLPLALVGIRNKKPAYQLNFANSANFFIVKQLERNLVGAFGISMTDRHKMVTQVNVLLRDRSPKTLLKADVAAFFESVPHDRLLDHLESRRALSRTSLMFVSRLLGDFRVLSGEDKGLPRGVGLSSFLAEAYLQDLDETIRAIPGVTYFSRYVDDIVVLSSHKRHDLSVDAVRPVLRQRLKEKGLSLNTSKTKVYSSDDSAKYRLIQLLGYEFRVVLGTGEVTLDMSKRRFSRYNERLKASFERHASSRGEGAHLALVSRIRLLTGNHRVAKPLGNTMMGVSFSNRSMIDVSPRLIELDRILQALVQDASLPPHILEKLEALSFADGFLSTRFERFHSGAGRVKNLGVIWKYEATHN
jgi:hypothetical protein